MTVLIFDRIKRENLNAIRSWFEDEELSNRMSYPDDVWFRYVTTTPNVYCWLVEESLGDIVGSIQVDVVDNIGYVGCYVRPDKRGKGICRQMLRQLQRMCSEIKVEQLVAEAEDDNVASHKCMEAAGFQRDEAQEATPEFVRYTCKLADGSVT